MTRQEVRAAIVALAEKLKQVPTVAELMKHAGIDRPEIRKHFGNYKQALEECNLEVPERGRKVELDRLFLDWAEVVRAFKKIPTVWEYERRSRYSSRPLIEMRRLMEHGCRADEAVCRRAWPGRRVQGRAGTG